jgi:membrane protein DedA with SNARE-associated domain
MISLHSPIVSWLLHYKYLVLLMSVIIEGPVITMFAGLAVASGLMNFWLAYIAILAGEVGGDVLYYALGYWGREKLLLRYKWLAKIFLPEVEKIERLFKKHPAKALIISKITHVIGLPFLIAAGIAKYNLARFSFYDLIATIPKSLALLAVGYLFSQAIASIDRDLRTASIIVTVFLIIFGAGYIAVGRYFYKKTIKENINS